MITAEQLAEARQEALDNIRRATRRKNAAWEAMATGRVDPKLSKDEREARRAQLAGERIAAYSDWCTLLISEHERGLLRPLEIYKAASITKQMFSKLRQNAAREQQQPARATLPPDDLGTDQSNTATATAYI